MADTNGDIFNDDAHFINTGTSYIDIATRDTSWFNGNVTLDNTGAQGMRIGAGTTQAAGWILVPPELLPTMVEPT
jgi:hypothetical protein